MVPRRPEGDPRGAANEGGNLRPPARVTASVRGVAELARRRPIWAYVLLAYGLTWVFTIPFVYVWRVVLDRVLEPWLAIFALAPFGPTFAALLMAWWSAGAGEVRRLLRRLRLWRCGPGPWLAALFLPIVVVALAVAAAGAAPEVFRRPPSSEGLARIPMILLLALPFGPLPEELGWRGWLLPRLQDRLGPPAASLAVGAVWTFWHLPMFWFPGTAIPSFLELGAPAVLLFLAQLIAEAMVLTALFNASGGSVLLAIVYHLTFNTAETILFRVFEEPAAAQLVPVYLWTVGLSWVVGLSALWLTRGRAVRDPAPPRAG